MDPSQSFTPIDNHEDFNSTKPKRPKNNNMMLIAIGAGIVAFILLITVIIYVGRASDAQSKLSTATADGQKQGAEAQKQIDEKARAEEKISDVRTYTAPKAAGSFSLAIPKYWSLTIANEEGGNTISALASPDYVEADLDKYALRFSLKEQSYEDAKKALDILAKEKDLTKRKVTAEATTLSGITGTRYTGQISSKVPKGTVVMVPVRDKTFIIETDENDTYLSTYDAILKTVKLNQ